MIEVEYTRLIFAAVAAILLGYACYVAAYVKHRNEIRDVDNRERLMAKENGIDYDQGLVREYRIEKTSTWYLGYRLALVGLIVVATAIGWAVSWFVGQDHVLTWVEDGALAAAGAIIGGFIADKYIIHSIADGVFFEKVEDPLVQRFLSDAVPVVEDKVKKIGFFAKRKQKKQAEKIAEAVADIPPVILEEAPAAPEDPIETMSFQEKVDLIEKLKRSL